MSEAVTKNDIEEIVTKVVSEVVSGATTEILQVMQNRFEAVDDHLDGIEDRLENVEDRTERIERKLDTTIERVDEHGQVIGKLQAKAA